MTLLVHLLQLVTLGAPLLVGGLAIGERRERKRASESIRKAFPHAAPC